MATNVDLRGQGDRLFYTQQISFLSETFGFASFPATGTYDFTIGFLPAGSRILRISTVTGVIAATGTAALILGNAVGGAQYMASTPLGSALGFVPQVVVAGTVAAYVSVDHTPVWARVTISTAGLTALTSDVILEYAHVSGPTGQF